MVPNEERVSAKAKIRRLFMGWRSNDGNDPKPGTPSASSPRCLRCDALASLRLGPTPATARLTPCPQRGGFFESDLTLVPVSCTQ